MDRAKMIEKLEMRVWTKQELQKDTAGSWGKTHTKRMRSIIRRLRVCPACRGFGDNAREISAGHGSADGISTFYLEPCGRCNGMRRIV